MTIIWQASTGNNSADTMYAYLRAMEADQSTPTAYLNVKPVNGNPTIGIGFDLVAGGAAVQNAVLIGLGFNATVVGASAQAAAQFAAGSWQFIEYGYIKQLRAQMVHGGDIQSMNNIMQNRASNLNAAYDAAVPVRNPKFAFSGDSAVRSVFDVLLPTVYEKSIYSLFTKLGVDLKNDPAYLSSRERMVLLEGDDAVYYACATENVVGG